MGFYQNKLFKICFFGSRSTLKSFCYRKGIHAFFRGVILINTATVLLGQVFARFNMPTVIGQFILIRESYWALLSINWVTQAASIVYSQSLGINPVNVLQRSDDLDLLKKYFKLSFTVASVGVILPVVFMGIASYFFGNSGSFPAPLSELSLTLGVSISVVVLQKPPTTSTRVKIFLISEQP